MGSTTNIVFAGSTNRAAQPTIAPNGKTFGGQVAVTLASSTTSARIYYTTDGSEPTRASSLYSGVINLTRSAVVKTRAFKDGLDSSSVAWTVFRDTTLSATVAVSTASFAVNESSLLSILRGSRMLEIRASAALGGCQAVSIFDVRGKEIFFSNIKDRGALGEISLHRTPAGTYIVAARFDRGSVRQIITVN